MAEQDYDENGNKPSGDSGGGIFSQLFFYIAIVNPIISWFLKPGRFPRQRAILYAISFLVLLAAINIGSEMASKPPSYYQVLGVSRYSTAADIKKAYKKRSLELHPDKNPSPTAAEEFNRLRDAYETLTDADLRRIYEHRGESEVLKARKRPGLAGASEESPLNLFIRFLSFYVVWLLMAYIMQFRAKHDGLVWTYVGLGVTFVAELNLQFNQYSIPAWLFPATTAHDIISIMHRAFPAYMNGCRIICGYLYHDQEEEIKKLTVALAHSHKQIYLMIRDLQAEMQTTKGGKHKNQSNSTASISLNTNNAAPLHAAEAQKSKSMPRRSKLARASPSSAASSENSATGASGSSLGAASASTAAHEVGDKFELGPDAIPQVQRPPKFKIPGIVWGVGMYFFLNWLLKG